MAGQDLAKVVSIKDSTTWTQGTWQLGEGYAQPDQSKFHVVAYDFGVKRNILRMLADRGCRLTVVPAQTSAEDVLKLNPDGIFLSNGPGDPEPCDYAIDAIKSFLETDIPVFGICLGHQLLALASGAKTLKMKFGHHGGNHPVKDLDNNTRDDHQRRTTVSRSMKPPCRPTCARDAHIAVRRHPAGHRSHRQAGVQLPGPPGSQPGPARRRTAVRPLHRTYRAIP